MNLKQTYDEAMAKLAEGPMFVPAVTIKRDNMNTAEQWISIKDQQPGDDQFPVIYGKYGADGKWTSSMCINTPSEQYGFTHWISRKLPAPPPRAKTLAELDAERFNMLYSTGSFGSVKPEWHAFKAALAYERAEIARILGCLYPGDKYESRLYAIEKRVKGGAS